MNWDDHDYCERCRLHSRSCWCWCPAAPITDQDPDDVCPGGEGHD